MAAVTSVAACAPSTLPAPDVTSVEPSRGSPSRATAVTIHGTCFFVGASQRLDTGAVHINDQFAVELAGDAGSTLAVTDTTRIDAQTLTATIPAGLAVGSYDATVRGPHGAGVPLPGAFTVVRDCYDDIDNDGVCDSADGCVDTNGDGFGKPAPRGTHGRRARPSW